MKIRKKEKQLEISHYVDMHKLCGNMPKFWPVWVLGINIWNIFIYLLLGIQRIYV